MRIACIHRGTRTHTHTPRASKIKRFTSSRRRGDITCAIKELISHVDCSTNFHSREFSLVSTCCPHRRTTIAAARTSNSVPENVCSFLRAGKNELPSACSCVTRAENEYRPIKNTRTHAEDRQRLLFPGPFQACPLALSSSSHFICIYLCACAHITYAFTRDYTEENPRVSNHVE